MLALVYAALLVGVLILLRNSLRRRKENPSTDTKIDIVAYVFMAVALAVLVVTCIIEAVTGQPIMPRQ